MASKTKADPPLLRKLAGHFGTDPGLLPVLERTFPTYERANLHQAIEGNLPIDEPGEWCGVVPRNDYGTTSLSKFVRPGSAKDFDPGPVAYVDETLPGNRRLACVKRGLRLFRYRGEPVAVFLDETRFPSPAI